MERGREHFRRRGLEIEQQTDRLREIHVGKVTQDMAVRVAVEQARKNGSLQQIVATVRIEVQHGSGELTEHHPRQSWIKCREQSCNVAVFPFECGLLGVRTAHVIVGQAHEHRCDIGRIVDEYDEVEQRNLRQSLRRIGSHPSAVGRIEITDRRIGLRSCCSACLRRS